MKPTEPEIFIYMLDGYLNSIRCFTGHPASLFGADYLEKKTQDLDSIVNESVQRIEESGTLLKKETVDFKYIQKILNKLIYSKLPKTDKSIIETLDWNLIEYYGLISTAEDENGAWNRLVGQEHIILEYIDENNNESVVFFVEHDNFIVATFL